MRNGIGDVTRENNAEIVVDLLRSTALAARELLQAAQLDVVLPCVLRRIGEAARVDRLVVWTETQDRNGESVHAVTRHWSAPPSRASVALALRERPNRQLLPVLSKLHAGESVWLHHGQLESPGLECLASLDIRGFVALPITIGGRYHGMISFEDDQTECAPDAELAEALEAAAHLIAAALEREIQAKKPADATAKSNHALQASIDAVREAKSPDQIVPRILEIVAQTFGAQSCSAFENGPSGTVWLRYWYFNGRTLLPEELTQVDPIKFALIRQLAAGFEVPDGYLGAPGPQVIGPVVLNHATGTAVPTFDAFAVANYWDHELNIGVAAAGIRASTLCIYRDLAHPFQAEEIALGEALAKQLGLALETWRLAEAARQTAVARDREWQARRLNEFLVHTVEGLSAGSDLSAALERLLIELGRSIGAAHLFLFRHQPEARTLRLDRAVIEGQIRRGPSGDELALWIQPFPDDITPAWRLMCADRRLFTPDNTPVPPGEFAWPGAFEYAERFALSDMGHIVLFAGDVPVGSIGLGFRGGSKIRPEDHAFIEAAAQQAAIIIRMLDLSEAARQAAIARERETAAEARAAELAKTQKALRQTLDAVALDPGLEDVPGRVLSAITAQLESNSSALWLFDSNTGKFSLHLVFDEGRVLRVEQNDRSRAVNVWGRGSDLVFQDHIHSQTPRVYQLKDLRHSHPREFAFLEKLGVKTMLGIPLLLAGKIIGSIAIRFDTVREISPGELELTQAMAHQATLSVQLTRLAARAGEAALSEERARFAREIHDTLAQGFAGILTQLGAATLVPGTDRSAIAPHLTAITELARSSLVEARRSVGALRPVASPPCQLDRTLPDFLEGARLRTSATLSFRVDGVRGHIEPYAETELCRIAQESVNNAVKHAAARNISIRVEFQDQNAVRLSVKDDGIGFDMTADTSRDRFGLIGMQERAACIGASLTVISETARGTEVIVQYVKKEG